MPPKKKSGSAKSKEKKIKRKQEQAEVAIALAKVKAAYDNVDHYMKNLPAFQTFKRNGLDLVISLHHVSSLSREDAQWAFDLMKTCMEDMYVKGGWGWNDREKWEELSHDSSLCLIARSTELPAPVGFTSFRFDLDHNVEVLYCYEIHVCPEVRRKGVGKFLMQILELIGHRAEMKKIVLTVFKENAGSNDFFREKLKYVDDDTSPSFYDPFNPEDYSYSILSKPLVRRVVKQVASSARPVAQLGGAGDIAPRAENELSRRHKSVVTQTDSLDAGKQHGHSTEHVSVEL